VKIEEKSDGNNSSESEGESSESSSSSSSESSESSEDEKEEKKDKAEELFKETFEKKQNPYKGRDAWDIEVVGEINENIGEYYSSDSLPSEGDNDSENDFEDKPMTLEQRRQKMWSTYQETPGREFAIEQWRKIEEETKFKRIKEEENKSSSGDENSQSEGESKSSNNSEKVTEEFIRIAKKDGVPRLSELESKANLQIKREKYQGPIERFVKKIGYGGNRVVKDNVKISVRGIMQDRILSILRENKYFQKSVQILPKRAKQLEKIAFMKKDWAFKDLWRNIEINTKELATSRVLSHKFLLGKLPSSFLLVRPEVFIEKKDRIIKKLITNYNPSKDRKKTKQDQDGTEQVVKSEEEEDTNPKVQNRSIMSVLNKINEKQEKKLEKQFNEQQERFRKRMLTQQKMGLHPMNSEIMPVEYHQMPHHPMYYEMDEKMQFYGPMQKSEEVYHYDQYQEYDPWMEIGDDLRMPMQQPEYQNFPQNPMKNEYSPTVAPQPQPEFFEKQIPADPRKKVASQNPEAKTNSEENDEYDPLQNF
jgi:hypothetical protein